MKPTNERSGQNTGFTLMELLTVIGIVAIVAAILFPVLSHVRERGRRTVCESNLRQIALAMHEYVQDNGGVYPLRLATEDVGGVSTLVEWDQMIFPYVKDNRIFRCPDEPADEPAVGAGIGGGRIPPFRDYTYNIIPFECVLATVSDEEYPGRTRIHACHAIHDLAERRHKLVQ